MRAFAAIFEATTAPFCLVRNYIVWSQIPLRKTTRPDI